MFVEEIDYLLPCPVLVVKSGNHDQPYRAQHFFLQMAVIAVRILVEAKLFSQAF